MKKVRFAKGKETVTKDLQLRFGQIGETDFKEQEIPGRIKFLVTFDRGLPTEEKWWIPEECLEYVAELDKDFLDELEYGWTAEVEMQSGRMATIWWTAWATAKPEVRRIISVSSDFPKYRISETETGRWMSV